MTPSTRTVGVPPTVTVRMTRRNNSGAPPVMRNSVCRGDLLLSPNVSWNTVGPVSLVVTSTLASESITTCGAGTGTTGPIIKDRWTPSTIGCPRDALRKRDAQPPADGLGQLVGPHGAVGVAHAPELLGITEVRRGDPIEPVTFGHDVLGEEGEPLGRRHEPAPDVRMRHAVGTDVLGHVEAVVAAGRRNLCCGHGCLLIRWR